MRETSPVEAFVMALGSPSTVSIDSAARNPYIIAG